MWDDDKYKDLPGLDSKLRSQQEDDESYGILAQPESSSTEQPEDDIFAQPAVLGNGGSRIDQLQDAVAKANERKVKAAADYDSIIKGIEAEERERLAAMQQPLTQEQIDKGRRASTLVGTITGALANIANGIAVGRGAQNATVPDGYTLAYQHWNDVEERNRKRQAEYQKIVDGINTMRATRAKEEVKRADAEAAAAELKLSAYEKLQSNERIAADNNETKRYVSDNALKGKAVKTPKTTVAKTKTNVLDGYRQVTRSEGSISIPENVDTIKGWMAMRDAAWQYIEDNKDRISGWSDKQAALKEISFTGSDSNKASQINKLLTAINASGIGNKALQDALDKLTPRQTATQNTNTNNGGNNGRTRQSNNTTNDSGLF